MGLRVLQSGAHQVYDAQQLAEPSGSPSGAATTRSLPAAAGRDQHRRTTMTTWRYEAAHPLPNSSAESGFHRTQLFVALIFSRHSASAAARVRRALWASKALDVKMQ
jgi:hypothetical protein